MAPPETLTTPRARYRLASRASLAPWLDAPQVPTLCFSDTHLMPFERTWSEDAPEDLAALIESLPAHEVLSLGDLTESVGLPARERDSLATSPRLAPLWALLDRRRARLVPGNHDVSARSLLAERFTNGRFLPGGFSLGRVLVRHGHECSPVETELVRRVGPVAVPLYERGRKLLRRGPERLRNERVRERVREGDSFVLFGHSHSAGLSVADPARAWANTGCFLRAAQSFIVLDGTEAALYRRA